VLASSIILIILRSTLRLVWTDGIVPIVGGAASFVVILLKLFVIAMVGGASSADIMAWVVTWVVYSLLRSIQVRSRVGLRLRRRIQRLMRDAPTLLLLLLWPSLQPRWPAWIFHVEIRDILGGEVGPRRPYLVSAFFYFADASNVDWFDTVLVALPHRIRNLAKRIYWHLKPPIAVRGILPLHKLLELLLERIVFLLFGLDRYVVYLYGVLRWRGYLWLRLLESRVVLPWRLISKIRRLITELCGHGVILGVDEASCLGFRVDDRRLILTRIALIVINNIHNLNRLLNFILTTAVPLTDFLRLAHGLAVIVMGLFGYSRILQ